MHRLPYTGAGAPHQYPLGVGSKLPLPLCADVHIPMTRHQTTGQPAELLAHVTLTMTQTKNDGEKTETPVRAELFDGQDAAHAAYDLCESVGLHNANEVTKIAGMLKEKAGDSYTIPLPTASSEKLFAMAKKETKAANFAAAGAAWSSALHGGSDGVEAITAEMKAEAEAAIVDAMRMQQKVAAFEEVYVILMTHPLRFCQLGDTDGGAPTPFRNGVSDVPASVVLLIQ